jgi:L-arabinose isomerase
MSIISIHLFDCTPTDTIIRENLPQLGNTRIVYKIWCEFSNQHVMPDWRAQGGEVRLKLGADVT